MRHFLSKFSDKIDIHLDCFNHSASFDIGNFVSDLQQLLNKFRIGGWSSLI